MRVISGTLKGKNIKLFGNLWYNVFVEMIYNFNEGGDTVFKVLKAVLPEVVHA